VKTIINPKINMTPEQEQIINQKIEEIAQILYQNTPAEDLKDFETIELAVRKQILEHISPKIGNFFLTVQGETKPEGKEPLKVVWDKSKSHTNKHND